jgi:hypothetical protein
MIRRCAAVLVVVAALGGCSNGGGGADDDRPSAAPATTTTKDGAGTTTRPSGITVTLAADRLVVGGNALVLGAPEFQVRSYLERALLDPVDEDVQDCGPGRLTAIEWKDVTVYLDEAETFVGWYARTPTFRTDAGVHVGSTRSAVEQAYPTAQITETTLGTELLVPVEGQADGGGAGLSGVFDEGGALTTLWSGATCVAR